jgi:hypothetical protein
MRCNHRFQVRSQYPESVAAKKLVEWSGLLFDLQAIPKVRGESSMGACSLCIADIELKCDG